MLKKIDWFLAVPVVLLVITGLIILQAINFKDASLAQDFDPGKQIISACLGLVALVVFARTDYRLWWRFDNVWYLSALGLLVLVLLIGQETAGARLAINLGFLQFQPTEVMKLALILVLGKFYAKHHAQLRRVRFLVGALLQTALPVGLILLQPDFGSAMVVICIWGVMSLMSNLSKWQLIGLAFIGLAVLPLMVGQLAPYQQARLQTFLSPAGSDPQGSGYNVLQSTIAVGSGQIVGRGLGGGSQGQLNFLPSQHTDFVFAVVAEKLGFLGAGLVLGLFLAVIVRGIVIAWRAADRFGMLCSSGVVALLLFHVVINIGMNLGIMPVTGIPLPFLSYGGSNLIVSLACIGLLHSIGTHRQELQFKT